MLSPTKTLFILSAEFERSDVIEGLCEFLASMARFKYSSSAFSSLSYPLESFNLSLINSMSPREKAASRILCKIASEVFIASFILKESINTALAFCSDSDKVSPSLYRAILLSFSPEYNSLTFSLRLPVKNLSDKRSLSTITNLSPFCHSTLRLFLVNACSKFASVILSGVATIRLKLPS